MTKPTKQRGRKALLAKTAPVPEQKFEREPTKPVRKVSSPLSTGNTIMIMEVW